MHNFGCRNRFGSSHKCDNNGKCRQWKHVLIHITRQTRQTCAQIFMSIERKLTSHVSMTHVIKTGFSFKHFVDLKFSSHIHTHPAIWILNQIVLFKSKMLCTVLSCHIGHGMTRTNQKCNSHLQSMSHATWMFLNVCIVEALRIKTECLAVQFRVQLLHGSGALTSSSYDLSL